MFLQFVHHKVRQMVATKGNIVHVYGGYATSCDGCTRTADVNINAEEFGRVFMGNETYFEKQSIDNRKCLILDGMIER